LVLRYRYPHDVLTTAPSDQASEQEAPSFALE
jgi:hypothetical protein